MENTTTKTTTKKKNFLRIIPKAAATAVSAISFQNHPFSPRRDNAPHKHKTHPIKGGFSGPIMIPAEARGRSRSRTAEPPPTEPSSPKVSCIGQIKCKKAKKSIDSKPGRVRKTAPPEKALRKKSSGIMKIFSAGRKSDASIDETRRAAAGGNPPRLTQMRKFASSRDTFANFDWTAAQIAPEEDDRDGRELRSDGSGDEVLIPFSAPLTGTGADFELEPRKEINLWKRRTMARPKPLQL